MLFGERHAQGARGETLLFPPYAPLSPVCCRKACGTQCGSLSYRARTVSRPGGKRYGLNARCHSAAPNILGAVAAPLCSDSLPRPLRARHRRASPRVLELHRDVLPRFYALCFGNSGEHCTHTALCHKSYRAYKAYKAYKAYSGLAPTLCPAQSALPPARLQKKRGRRFLPSSPWGLL